jgi:PAS domain S-box-containing protein
MTDKFSLLASIASDWWWEMDADLRFTFLSDRFTEIYGLPVSVALGKRRTEIDRTDYENPAWQDHLRDLENRRSFRDFETTFVDANGVSRPVMISGAPLFASGGAFTGYVGVGHDLTELRHREHEAAIQAANLQSILDNIEQGVVLLDNNSKIVAYNHPLAAFLQLDDRQDRHGASYEQIVRYLADRGEYDPEDKETAIAKRMHIVQSSKRFVGERRRDDGRILSVTFNALPAGGGVMTYSDVTEARTRERRLTQSEESFRYLFVNSPLPMWVYALETLNFLEVNDAAIAKYGYTGDEFRTMTIMDVRPPEDVERMKHLLKPYGSGQFSSTGWRHRRKDGRSMDVDLFLSDIEFNGERARLAVIIDITARKEAERENQSIVDTSQDVILATNSYGTFVRVSPSATKALGYTPDEMVGRSAQDFIFPEDLEPTRNEMRTARRGRASRNFRSRYIHKDGHLVTLLWMGAWSEADRRHFFIGRDLTDFEHTEALLRQAQKMESVGQLTGGVAHDFNNILMVIMANIEALGEHDDLDPELRRRIDGIDKATERAADLTHQLLAFSRQQPLRPRRTNINDLVATTGSLLRRSLGEQVEIEAFLADDLWNVEIDRSQLESALVNLSINARDAMPDGGRLLIETKNTRFDLDYIAQHPDAAVGDYVMVAVTDSGSGISPDIVDRVFEPFFTTKEVGKGTGLGLSMVYGFIKQSNGHVNVYSELGKGTSFKLYLPRFDAKKEDAMAAPSAPLPRGNERILVVEDDAQVRAEVVRQLRSLGYSVGEAPGALEGLAAFEVASPQYDLLLTDVIMPGPMNGKSLADEVARRWADTKLVFMSGYAENAIVHHGRVDEGSLLLSKPFRKSDLAQMIRRALDGDDPEL